jgi:type VI protein secretion system component VasA
LQEHGWCIEVCDEQVHKQLKVGDIRVSTATSPAVATFTNLTGVTQPLPPPVGRDLTWRVLAHMAMTYRSITDLEVLRATVDIYNFQAVHDRQAARANQLRLAAIKAIRVRPTDRLYRGAPVRGELTLTLAGETRRVPFVLEGDRLELGVVRVGSSAREFEAAMNDDYETMKKLVRQAGIKAE